MTIGRLSKGQKDPDDYKVKRCEVVLPDGTPCNRPFAFYVNNGVRMCTTHDHEWRLRK